VRGIADDLGIGSRVKVRARAENGSEIAFRAIARIDTPVELEYYRNGGILHTVLRNILKGKATA
jgi:aconitate hydratase